MKSRVLVVGTGGWAEKHLEAYRLCRDVEPVGLVGHRDVARLAAVADRYGVSARFTDVRRAIEETRPQMVDIVATPGYRLEGVQACAGTDVRLVNIEKPMALIPSEGYAIEKVCADSGLLLTVNHQKKFNAPWARARDSIAAGELGDLRFLRTTCKGNMLEQGTHIVDMLLFFHDYKPITWVMGQVADREGLDKPRTPAPDSCIAEICFADDVRASVTMGNVGWNIPNETNKWLHFAVEAYGTLGHLVISLNQTLSITTYGDGKTRVEPSSWDDTFVQGIADHLDAAARYARDPGVGHISCLENSLRSFQAVMGIYASAACADRVELPCRFEDSVVPRAGVGSGATPETRGMGGPCASGG